MIKDSPVQLLPRPENKGFTEKSGGTVKPYELDPELALLKIAELMIARLPPPSKVSKAFIIRRSLFSSLNHTPDNRSGYDCSLRNNLYWHADHHSVNEDGIYLERFWAWMMKPKYVINGMPIGQAEQEREGIISRVIGRFTGKGNKSDQQQGAG